MKNRKNLCRKSLAMFVIMCIMFSFCTIFAEAKSLSGGTTVDVTQVRYTITQRYVDEDGVTLQANTTDTLIGTGNTYSTAPDDIDDYLYVGYYVDGVGNINNLQTGNPSVTSRADGSDSTGGVGSYTLVAVYTPDKNGNEIPDEDENYAITERFVDTNGATLRANNTVYVNGGVIYNGVVPTIPGYSYRGFYFTDATGTHNGGSAGTLLTGNPNILMRSTNGFNSYNVTMVWEYDASQWATVTYDKNAADATGTMSPITILRGVASQLSANRFTRPGYNFLGWSTTPTGSVEYVNRANITPAGDITLYAVWEYDPNQWATITYIGNGADVTGTMPSETVLRGVATTLRTNAFVRLGYLFAGWSTTPTGAVQYADGATVTPTGNITLYAVWRDDYTQRVTITYNANSPDATGTMAAQSVIRGVSATLNSNAYRLEDYIFLGWSTSTTGSAMYSDRATITPANDITLYAVWGTPDVYADIVGSSQVNVGDTISYEFTLGNRNTVNSTTWYDTVFEIYLSQHVRFDEASFVLKLNGTTVSANYTYNPATRTISVSVGDLTPGQEYKATFEAVALASGQGLQLPANYWAEGALTRIFASPARSGGASTNSRTSVSGSGASVKIR